MSRDSTISSIPQLTGQAADGQHAALQKIRASAGSGKTWELTRRFLEKLQHATKANGSGCIFSAETACSWTSLLAITFTNKAASEMQTRILDRLKDTALEKGDVLPGWTAEEAELWVNHILHHYGALNVRTIDSLLHIITRLGALDLQISPEFDIFFSAKEALAPVLDKLMESARTDNAFRKKILDACACLFYADPAGCRFIDSGKIRTKVLEITEKILEEKCSPGDGWHRKSAEEDILALAEQFALPEGIDKDFLTLRRELLQNVEAASREVQRWITDEKLQIKKDFSKALTRASSIESPGSLPDSVYLGKENFDDCVLKASRGKASQSLLEAYSRLKEAYACMNEKVPQINALLAAFPYLELTKALLQKLPAHFQQENILPASRVPYLASEILRTESGVSEAICRLGTQLTHILIDEFQDTSQSQWDAIRPFVREALSRGGSLTWVGDQKQAIYSWRGGKAELFDQIEEKEEGLTPLAGLPETTILPMNRRSRHAIVQLNNKVFGQLDDPDMARKLLGLGLPSRLDTTIRQSAVESGIPTLVNAFAHCTQELQPGKEGGLVHFYRLTGGKTEELDEQIASCLLQCLAEVHSRRPWKDVAILVRSNKDAAKTAHWLLKQEIPVITSNSLLLQDQPLIVELLAFLKFLIAPDDDLAFWTVVSGRKIFLPLSGLEENDLLQWLAARQDRKTPLYQLFRVTFPTVWEKWIDPFHSGAGLLSVYDTVSEYLKRMHVRERFPEDSVFVLRFLEIVHHSGKMGFSSIPSFLDVWNTYGDNEKSPMSENLDAVRVVTIHKSKGLQYPVVIIPWHNLLAKGQKGPQKVRVFGRDVHVERENAFPEEAARHRVSEIQESLHLLYVAWTRPEEELHCFLYPGNPQQSRFPDILDELLSWLPEAGDTAADGDIPAVTVTNVSPPDEKDGADEEPEEIEAVDAPENPEAPGMEVEGPGQTGSGEAVAAPQEAAEEPVRECSIPAPGYPDFEPDMEAPMSWLPQLRIFRNPLSELKFTPKRRGTLAHLCLSMLRLHPGIPVQEAVHLAVMQGLQSQPLPLADSDTVRADLEKMLTWFANLEQAPGWLEHGIPEQGIIDENGALFRADLIVYEKNKIVVVDYKTGHPDAGQLQEYREQLGNYMRLSSLAAGKPAEGYLVFLDEHSLEKIPAYGAEPSR